jgi:hypothetical protein
MDGVRLPGLDEAGLVLFEPRLYRGDGRAQR